MPDPLKPGHIEGQNPNTPERLPGHTRWYHGRRARYSVAVFCIAAGLIAAYAIILGGVVSTDRGFRTEVQERSR
jgi:hypothetical protein